MEHYVGIDVSLESSSICVVDGSGRIVREAKIASEPGTLTAWLQGLGLELARIGLEAGPLSQWLYAGMRDAGLAVELLETRHVRRAFEIMPVKTDRKDARHCAADAAGMVSPGSLQVVASTGTACASDGTKVGAEEATRFRDEHSRHLAWFWLESGQDVTARF